MTPLSKQHTNTSPLFGRLLQGVGWAGVALLWLILIVTVYRITLTHSTGGGDFFAYYKAARTFSTGEPLYTGIGNDMPYLYPPLLAMLLAPVAAITEFRPAALIWLVVNLVVLALTLTLLSRTIARPRDRMALWAGAALYASTLQTLWIGQVSILLFALATGTWLAYRAGQPVLAGVLLALAVWLKVYPIFGLIYFVWRRDWRVVTATAISGALLGLIQLAAVGPAEFVKLITVVLPGLAASGRFAHSNHSILGFAYRLFEPTAQVIPLADSPALLLLTRVILTLIVVGGAAMVIARPPLTRRAGRRFDLEYGLVTLVSLLLGTLYGVQAIMPVLLVFFLLLRNAPPRLRPRYAGLCLSSGLLISVHFYITLAYLRPPSDVQMPALLLSTAFFGLMLLWLLLVVADYRASDAV